MLRFLSWRLLVALVAVAPASLALAGPGLPGLPLESPPQSAPQPTPRPEPDDAVIALPDIPSRALVMQGRLRAIRSEARPTAPVIRIEADLEAFLKAVEEQRSNPENAVRDDLSPAELDALDQLWSAALSRTATWESSLTRRTQALQDLASELRASAALWTRTRDAERDEPLPPALVDRVNATLGSIAEVEAIVVARRDHVLGLADHMLEIQYSARDAVDSIEQIRDSRRRALTATDSPPLWRAFGEARDTGKFLAGVRSALGRHTGAILVTALLKLRALFWLLLTYLGLCAGFALLRRRLRSSATQDAAQDAATAAALRVLDRPIASATLVSLLLAWALVPHAPSSVYFVTGLLALLSTLRILPGFLVPALRGPLYLLCGLYSVTPLITLSDVRDPLERVLVVILGLAAAAALGRLVVVVRRGGLEAVSEGWRSSIVGAAWTGIATLGVAIPANIAGRSQLGAFLTIATIRSAFLAVLLLVLGLVLRALWVSLLRSSPAQGLASVRHQGERLQALGIRLIRAGLPVLWALGALSLFEIRAPLANAVRRALSASLEIRHLRLSLGMVLSFFVVLGAAALLSRVLRFFLDADVLPRLPLARGLPTAISQTLHYALLVFGFFAALAAAGLEFSRFAILGGAFGIGLAFGMQTIVNNFVSGLILLYERPIRLGDTIEVDGTTGTVTRIGIRSSTIRTADGAEFIVPNADMISKAVTNWTLTDRRRRLEIAVGVAYGTDPEMVLRLLEKTAAAHSEVSAAPAPAALFSRFGDSTLDFSVRFWTPQFEDALRVRSEVTVAISRALAEAGIEIPFPQRELHVRSGFPDGSARPPERAEG